MADKQRDSVRICLCFQVGCLFCLVFIQRIRGILLRRWITSIPIRIAIGAVLFAQIAIQPPSEEIWSIRIPKRTQGILLSGSMGHNMGHIFCFKIYREMLYPVYIEISGCFLKSSLRNVNGRSGCEHKSRGQATNLYFQMFTFVFLSPYFACPFIMEIKHFWYKSVLISIKIGQSK